MHAENSSRIREDLRQLLRDLHTRSEDLPHLKLRVTQTLGGQDPPPIQLHERMERLWWQFSEACKKIHGPGGRTLSFGRSRHLTDYPK
eukprot:6227865-Alexandrium_andersonii.AAC.1